MRHCKDSTIALTALMIFSLGVAGRGLMNDILPSNVVEAITLFSVIVAGAFLGFVLVIMIVVVVEIVIKKIERHMIED